MTNASGFCFLCRSPFRRLRFCVCTSLDSACAGAHVWTCKLLLHAISLIERHRQRPLFGSRGFQAPTFVCWKCVFEIFNNGYCARWSGGRALSSSDPLHLSELAVLPSLPSVQNFFFSSCIYISFLFFVASAWSYVPLQFSAEASLPLSVHPFVIDLASSQFCCSLQLLVASLIHPAAEVVRDFAPVCVAAAWNIEAVGFLEGADLAVKCVGGRNFFFALVVDLTSSCEEPHSLNLQPESLHNKQMKSEKRKSLLKSSKPTLVGDVSEVTDEYDHQDADMTKNSEFGRTEGGTVHLKAGGTNLVLLYFHFFFFISCFYFFFFFFSGTNWTKLKNWGSVFKMRLDICEKIRNNTTCHVDGIKK